MQVAIPQQVEQILIQLQHNGYEAYLVGGCVRDALRGVTPSDWDIATSARPEQTIACFAGEQLVTTGLKHGTVTLIRQKQAYEITTYRIDGSYQDGRHPDKVQFVSSLEMDLARRDFTVNAMAYHPKTGLVDPFGGRQDLADGVIRCVGAPQERFAEDALRIMRALRFASVLGFRLEEQTAAAIHQGREMLHRIAVERIMTELYKLLCGQQAAAILTAFSDVIFTVIPELAPTKDYYQNTPYHNRDIWGHIVESIAQVQNTPLLRLTMLLHDVAKPLCYTETVEYPYLDSDKALTIGHFKGHPALGAQMAKTILRRLKCDSKTIETVSLLIYWHDERPPAKPIPVKRILSKIGAENFLLLQEVRRADTKAQRPTFCAKTVAQIDAVEALGRRLLSENACLSIGQLAVNGKDLLSLGIPAGKQIGETLSYLLDAVIAEKIRNERQSLLDAAIEYAKIE